MNIIRWTLLARLKWITVELYSWGLSEYSGMNSLKHFIHRFEKRIWFSHCSYVCLWLCGWFSCTVSRNAWEWDLFVIWASQGFSRNDIFFKPKRIICTNICLPDWQFDITVVIGDIKCFLYGTNFLFSYFSGRKWPGRH